MEWQDDAIVLGAKRHGESSVILEAMTGEKGRHLGIVRGGRSTRMRAVLQPGNSIRVTWRARLEDHLGAYSVEPVELRAAWLMENQIGTFGIQTLAGHLRLLPERDPHKGLYNAGLVLIDHLSDLQTCGQLMVRFELELLNELGFGLELSRCADTGKTENLIYVSPKSGRAVCAESGEPWADRMLRLPSFLANRDFLQSSSLGGALTDSKKELEAGFRLTGFFLDRHVYGPRAIRQQNERDSFIKALMKLQQSQE